VGKYKSSSLRNRNSESGFDKFFGGVIFFGSCIGSVWVTLKLMNWFVPDETVASSSRRLAEEILFFPVLIVFFFLTFFLMTMSIAILRVQFNKILNIQHNPEYDSKEQEVGKSEKIKTTYPSAPYSSRKISPTFHKALIGFVFILFVGLTIFFDLQTMKFQKIARPATGVIKDWVEHGMGRHRYTVLEVQYTTEEGAIKTLESTHHSLIGFLMPNVGQTVKVLYNPNDPTDFRVDQFSEMWSQTIVCAFFSLIVLIFGTIGIWLKQRG
jgi:hypothetical protein